ncbi:hypothetical protein [Deinococcus sp. LM3]|uniref:hypothetical protein n=1 Tax=Deinococcus sp. LM3 TaxID=1938608 RepID=UPI00117D7FAD|nr:hypothetical protein [Deinococcus sp. LM3]
MNVKLEFDVKYIKSGFISGRSNVLTVIYMILTSQFLVWVSKIVDSTTGAGVLQAMINLFGFMNPVMTGIGNFTYSQIPKSEKSKLVQLIFNIRSIYIIAITCLIIIVAIITLNRGIFVGFYFDNVNYANYANLIPIVGLTSVALVLSQIEGVILSSLGYPNLVARYQLISTIACIILLPPLCILFGIYGIAIARLFAEIVKGVLVFRKNSFISKEAYEKIHS